MRLIVTTAAALVLAACSPSTPMSDAGGVDVTICATGGALCQTDGTMTCGGSCVTVCPEGGGVPTCVGATDTSTWDPRVRCIRDGVDTRVTPVCAVR